MRPRLPSTSDAYLRVAFGTLGIGAFPLVALGYQTRIVGSFTYAVLALAAVLLLALAVLWPPRLPTRRVVRGAPRQGPTERASLHPRHRQLLWRFGTAPTR